MKPFSLKTSLIPILLVGLIVFVYAVIRAFNVSFTYDESLSYLAIKLFNFRITGMEHVENHTTMAVESNRLVHFFAANNHYLNTIGMWLCSKLLGDSEFSLRLPNLLAHLLYLFFSYKILKDLKHKVVGILAFVVMATNPYLLEFFGLARGYGLAVAFMMGSLYFLKCWIEGTRPTPFLSFLFAMLSTLSNLVFFNVYLSLAISIFAIILFKQDSFDREKVKETFLRYQPTLFLNILFLVLILPLMIFLKLTGQLFYGAEQIISGTVSSIVQSILLMRGGLPGSLYYIIVFIICIPSIYLLARYFRERKFSFEFILPVILVLMVFLVLFQHFILGTPLPKARTAMYFIPLVTLVILYCLEQLFEKSRLRYLGLILLIIFATASVFNLASKASFKYTYSWHRDNNTRIAFEAIIEHAGNAERISVCSGKEFEPTLNFYRISKEIDRMTPVSVSGRIDGSCDYFYFPSDSLSGFKTMSGQIIEYPDTKSFLFIKK